MSATEFEQPPATNRLRFWWLDGDYDDYTVKTYRRMDHGVLLDYNPDTYLMTAGSMFIPYTSFRAMKVFDDRK